MVIYVVKSIHPPSFVSLLNGKKRMLAGDRDKRLARGCSSVVGGMGGQRQLGGKWQWVVVVARLWFTRVVDGVLQRWSMLGGRQWLGG